MNSYTKLSRAFILIFLSISLFSTASNAEINTTNNKVILIDDAHGQFINSSLLTGAIQTLTNQGFKVLPLTTSFSQQTLNGVDMVIIPNPKATSKFTDTEMYSLNQWMQNEPNRGMILLSNPLNTQNTSLSGSGSVFNQFFNYKDVLLGNLFDTSNSADVVVNKYQNTTSDPTNLYLDVNSSVTLPDINSTLHIETKSTSISVTDAQTILSAGYDSFYVTKDGSYQNQDKNNKLFGGLTYKTGRIVVGGSTLMFSDLPNQYETNQTWFNSANNSIFFTALVKWSLNISNASFTKEVSKSFFVALALATGVAGTILVALGFILYATGKEMKIFEIDQDFLRAQASENQEDTGLTKSQKRLQQRSKNK